MASTKGKIKEQIQRIYQRFLERGDVNRSIDHREVELMLNQSINSFLSVETKEKFSEGFIDIPRCNIIKYASQTVVSDSGNNRSYVAIPAIPLSLPRDMGVWSVSDIASPDTPYIPLPSQTNIVMQGTNVAQLEQQTGYHVEGLRIYFTKDITISLNGSVANVDIYLLVSDLSLLSETDLLPLSPEIEKLVIADVLKTISLGVISQQEMNSITENDNI